MNNYNKEYVFLYNSLQGSRKMARLSIIVKTLDCGRKFKEGRDIVGT